MRLIDQIKSSNAWFQVMKEFETLSPEDYSINRAGTCKKMVSSLTSEIGPALLIPAHPKGSDNKNAWHSYAVIKSESGKPEDDVIVDLTAGQIIPDIPPFVGTRLELHEQIRLAYSQNRINPEFMGWFSGEMSKEGKHADAEIIFENFYGHESLNAFSNQPIHQMGDSHISANEVRVDAPMSVEHNEEEIFTALLMQQFKMEM